MSSNRINITDLDFDTIKNNLKEFLRNQTVFSDYNFEGSSLNVLLDILAYNTHYNAYYMNMVANEAFLDSAILRNSVVSHAKSLGYIPASKKAATAIIDITLTPTQNNSSSSLTLNRGTSFRSNLIDNSVYNFVTLEDVIVNKANDAFTFLNLEIRQGNLVNYVYTYNVDSNPKGIFVIPDENVDTSTLKVTVQESISNVYTEIYTLASDILEVNQNSLVYYLQEGINGKYEIYFGNGTVGKAINDGSIITLNYLITDGEIGNDINKFTLSSKFNNISFYTINNVRMSSGGVEKETIDSIKLNSISQYTTQNRLVTAKDYEYYLLKNYPYVDSISVWGGEEQDPPVYGKVFVSMKPKNNYYIPTSEKERIINEILLPKSMVTTEIEIIDPEYLYLKIHNIVKYLTNKLSLNLNQLNSLCVAATLNYAQNNLNQFNSIFITSKLQQQLNEIDLQSIVGTETSIRLEKRIVPELNVSTTYEINFNLPLYRGTTLNRLSSSEFVMYDNSGVLRNAIIEEVPESYTGISEIKINSSGYNYTSTPRVTITGDGYGATAIAKIVNRKLENITITNRGINYTKAIVTISGGGGYGATATAILNAKFGTLRAVYFNKNAERQIINNNVGVIDYEQGKISIFDLNIQKINTFDNILRIDVKSEESMISSTKNTLLVIDETDPSSIVNEFIT